MFFFFLGAGGTEGIRIPVDVGELSGDGISTVVEMEGHVYG